MQSKILYLLTRTPLHIGAGASVGAIDQPVQRERHTGFPIIPATSQKGSFADQWPTSLSDCGKPARVKILRDDKGQPLKDPNGKLQLDGPPDPSAWLFGSDKDLSFAGSLIFSEARLLAFPIRSAKGSFAWITCPLMLQRAKRDGAISADIPPEPTHDQAIFLRSGDIPVPSFPKLTEAHLDLDDQIVLEEYCLNHTGTYPAPLAVELASLLPNDPLFQSITERLVILSNGMMSHFASTACEIAQHVRINDETDTADEGGLFNQENVPGDTLFYALLSSTNSRVPHPDFASKADTDALTEFTTKINTLNVFQFGGDATTGLGFCSVVADDPIHPADSTQQPVA